MKLLLPPSLGELKASARAELLEKSLSRRLGTQVTVEVAKSYDDLEQRLLADEVELAWAPPHLCAKVEPTARAILKAVRGGRSVYRGALVVRAGEIGSLAGLQGKVAAWVDPLSTGGYLLPLAHLRLLGHEPDRLFAEQKFLGSYRNVLRALLNREADVTAIYTLRADEGAVRASLAEHLGAEEKSLAPLAYTDEAPSDGLVLSARLSAPEAEALIKALVSQGEGARGPTMLLEVCDAQGFLLARPGDYRPLRKALR